MDVMVAIRVRDLMTEPVFSIGPEATLSEVGDLMENKRIRHVPVVDEDHNVMGVVSHRDLLRSAVGQSAEMPLASQAAILHPIKVRDVMARDVEVVDASENIATAAQIMLAGKYGCLPVVDGTRLTGILTEADFIRYLVERR
jgi:CBS domain-containing membrane protein